MKASRKRVDPGRFGLNLEDFRDTDRDGVSGRGIVSEREER
jgi:hypothetical protein